MLSNFCKTYKSTEIFFSCLNIPSSLPRYGISSACDWCWEKSQGGKWKLKVWTVSSDPSPPPTYFHNKCSVIEFVLRTLRTAIKTKTESHKDWGGNCGIIAAAAALCKKEKCQKQKNNNIKCCYGVPQNIAFIQLTAELFLHPRTRL